MTELEELDEVVTYCKYFWEEKGDLERCAYFTSKRGKELLQKYRPEILKAWDDYKISITMLNAVLKN